MFRAMPPALLLAFAGDTLGASDIGLRLGAVVVLVLMNGFMVAAEFALVGARRAKVAQMAEEGDRPSKDVLAAFSQIDRFISTTQLGITVASLALGWIGEPALASLMDRLFAAMGFEVSSGAEHLYASIITAFAIITFLHIVLGELAPKSLALTSPEQVSRFVARPILWLSHVMSPFISLLNGAANGVLRLFGVQPISDAHHVHSPDELRLLVIQSHAHGQLDESDRAMLAGVFDFHQKTARDVMLPRTRVVAIPLDASEEDVWKVLRSERYSRYPVFRDTLDDIVGVFLAKDLWLNRGNQPFSVQTFVREALYIPQTRAAENVLDDLRKTRAHLAVVLDEHGGTAGIVTLEDLVEEIVGDIADEYDVIARESVAFGDVLELAGTLSLVDVRSDHQIPIPDGPWSSLGGYVFSALGHVPRIADRVTYPGGELEVIAVDGRRVAAVRVHRIPEAAEDAAEDDSAA
jgi:CBS domain containing-hemolysin-like protein